MEKAKNHCRHLPMAASYSGLFEGGEREIVRKMIDGLDRPKDIIEKVIIGDSLIGVLAGGRLGLSSHLGSGSHGKHGTLVGELCGQTLYDGARLSLQPDMISTAIGIAAINAGFTGDVSEESSPIQEEIVTLSGSGEVALVGKFPFFDWLKERVKKLHLFELQNVGGKVPEDQWSTTLQRASVAAITSTVFLTRYSYYYLSNTKNAKTILIGPSTPLTPVLFEFGADVLAGSRVTDPERVIANLHGNGCYSEVVKGGGIEFVLLRK